VPNIHRAEVTERIGEVIFFGGVSGKKENLGQGKEIFRKVRNEGQTNSLKYS
jgi:hypothetical protein